MARTTGQVRAAAFRSEDRQVGCHVRQHAFRIYCLGPGERGDKKLHFAAPFESFTADQADRHAGDGSGRVVRP